MLHVQGQLFKGGTAANGFTLIGNGSYAKVFASASSPNMVLKTGGDIEDGALAWLMFCQYNQGRKGVPVIESLVFTDEGYACTMKRYDSMSWGSQVRSQVQDLFPDQNLDNLGSCDLESWVTSDEEAIVELGLLMQEFESITCLMVNDIHTGNYMWCKETGSLIITDPCACSMDHTDIAARLQEFYGDDGYFTLTMQ